MQDELFKPIAILGAGSWGTALALYLARRGQTVHLWSIDKTEVDAMRQDHANNQFLPGFPFPPCLIPMDNLAEAVQDAEDILIAVPSVGFRQTLALLKPLLKPTSHLICATKGLDANTGQLLHDITREILGEKPLFAALSGPSFAREVAAGLPTAVAIACQDQTLAAYWAKRFDSTLFHIYLHTDVIGVEIGCVTKNVVAIATGISDGLNFGANTRSAIITRGLAEMISLSEAVGGQIKTMTGLAGVGDLILTCTDDQSRNRRLGLALGKGHNMAEAEREIGQVIEGKRNAELICQLAQKHGVNMPVCTAVLKVIQGKVSPRDAIELMLARE